MILLTTRVGPGYREDAASLKKLRSIALSIISGGEEKADLPLELRGQTFSSAVLGYT